MEKHTPPARITIRPGFICANLNNIARVMRKVHMNQGARYLFSLSLWIDSTLESLVNASQQVIALADKYDQAQTDLVAAQQAATDAKAAQTAAEAAAATATQAATDAQTALAAANEQVATLTQQLTDAQGAELTPEAQARLNAEIPNV